MMVVLLCVCVTGGSEVASGSESEGEGDEGMDGPEKEAEDAEDLEDEKPASPVRV